MGKIDIFGGYAVIGDEGCHVETRELFTRRDDGIEGTRTHFLDNAGSRDDGNDIVAFTLNVGLELCKQFLGLDELTRSCKVRRADSLKTIREIITGEGLVGSSEQSRSGALGLGISGAGRANHGNPMVLRVDLDNVIGNIQWEFTDRSATKLLNDPGFSHGER